MAVSLPAVTVVASGAMESAGMFCDMAMATSAARLLRPGGLAAVRAGWQSYPNGIRQMAFITEDFALIWLVTGSATLILDGHATTIPSGALVQRPRGRAHDLITDQATSWYFLGLPASVEATLATCGARGLGGPPGHLPPTAARRRAWQARIDAIDAWTSPDLSPLVCRLQQEAASLLAEAAGTADPRLQRACALLAQDLHRPIDMAGVAMAVGMRGDAFRAAFARCFGVPPKRYRTLRRLEAAQALISGGTTVAAAAAALGYTDATALGVQFRRHLGYSPGSLRGRHGA